MPTLSSVKAAHAFKPPSVAVSPSIKAAIAACMVLLGTASIWSSLLSLWALWTTDALKSIGMIVPVVSFVLVLRAWRALQWEMDGTWWGLALLGSLALLVRIREQAIMVLIVSPEWSLNFPPHSLVVLLYGLGAVLLFGGLRLAKAALFPIALLLFVNPIPHIFNVYVDLPLQRVSAHIARSFAIALGQPLSPDKLRLMFTPNFGMFIAPGCNGIRGAVTMGLIALVAGYLYRFRWQAHALVILGAILLGYIFNFVRLCVLVLFYVVALHIPSLQENAENADYLIGAALFFSAVYALHVMIQRLGNRQDVTKRIFDQGTNPAFEPSTTKNVSFSLRAAGMAVLIVLCSAGTTRFFKAIPQDASLLADERALGKFPEKIGTFALVRSWNENLLTGALLFHWAEYAQTGSGAHISLGVSPMLGSHDTMICHSARGEDPIWHGQSVFQTLRDRVSFNTSLYNDGATQYLEATTLCHGARCGEYSSPRVHFGFVYSRPDVHALWRQDAERPIPILLRAETIDTTLRANVAQQQLSAEMASFLSGVGLDSLTQPYRRP